MGRIAWEYKVLTLPNEATLNALGEEEWEIAGAAEGFVYLKRPRPGFRDQVTLDQKQRYYAQWAQDASLDEEDRP